MLTPDMHLLLSAIAANGRTEATTPELVRYTDRLFELGYLNITPPGWCYVVNDAGREALAAYARQRATEAALVAALSAGATVAPEATTPLSEPATASAEAAA